MTDPIRSDANVLDKWRRLPEPSPQPTKPDYLERQSHAASSLSSTDKRALALIVKNALAAMDAPAPAKVGGGVGSIESSPPTIKGAKAEVDAAIKKATSAKPQSAALYEAAARKALAAYGIQPATFSSITFKEVPKFGGFAQTDGSGNLEIAPKAFASAGLLASTLHHESIHLQQLAEKRAYWAPVKSSPEYKAGFALNQIEAYDRQLADPARFGLTQTEISQVMFERQRERGNLVEADEALAKSNPNHVPYADKIPSTPTQGAKIDPAKYMLTSTDAANLKVKP